MRPALLFSALIALVACGESSGMLDDAGVGADATPLRCDEHQPLRIGHCIDSATDAACLDFAAETRQFVDLEDSGPIRPIIGLQGSPMFVLAVEGEGIRNGENEFAPLVDLQVTRGDEYIGGFSSRPLFIEGDASDVLRAPQLYVVSFFADEQIGLVVDAEARVVDQDGQEWCRMGSFEIGELTEAEPLP